MFFKEKLKDPIFLKETSDAKEHLQKLNEVYKIANGDVKKKIEQEMKMLSYGIVGEEKIFFELKNSYMPMYVLHDLHLTDGDLSAQIDYLVITKRTFFVIECKNLIGDIEINANGDFIRTFPFAGEARREGIYSPITQNQRHIEMIKKLRSKTKSNFLTKALFEKYFYRNYRSIVVLANPKTILNDKNAPKEVRDQVIKVDQLIAHMKKINSEQDLVDSDDKDMENLATFFLNAHTKKEINYQKYGINFDEVKEDKKTAYITLNQKSEVASDKDEELIKKLKQFRLSKSKEEQIKAYIIFNDKQMYDLLDKMPSKIDDLMKVSGFGQVKCDKYGLDILKILNNHRVNV